MAQAHVETLLQFFKDTDQPGKIAPYAQMLQDYYIALLHLLNEGKVDPDMWSRIQISYQQHDADISKRYGFNK
jgi:hypothetical protein